MNRPLPQRDRGHRISDPRRAPGPARALPGALRLVGGTAATASPIRMATVAPHVAHVGSNGPGLACRPRLPRLGHGGQGLGPEAEKARQDSAVAVEAAASQMNAGDSR